MMFNPITPSSSQKKPFQVLAHTDEILIIQTNAGVDLATAADKQPATEKQKAKLNSYGRFNLGLHVNDDPAQVLHNRAQLLQLINGYLAEQTDQQKTDSAVEAIYWLSQIHSNQVIRIEDEYLDNLSLTPPAADALVTAQSCQALAIMTADCVPIVIYDPNTQQVAAIHAGWQGLANGVIFEAYKELTNLTSLTPNSVSVNLEVKPIQAWPLQAWIGACISQACYEVSGDVVDKLLLGCEKMGMEAEQIRPQIVAAHEDANKAWLDLPKLAQLQLEQLGIAVEQPTTLSDESKAGPALACSYEDSSYYSYRRKTHLGEGNTGRMALLVVKLKT
ncbi:polyphenol oxidase family protein [Psychrobacter phenylpyruvicus]|uniref:Laccase domain protein yfiH n=1 Tax=Psychrobacter phenylpyruvicus TaxID=29432 RepID=A0A379LIQ2_9GAMM|nr:polyphenol oxidase family protein [Psychrobacter phenylpyruvicus]SUD90489.1 Laccase domain protein yfiH [Psychrobacter phenylpyruvicus]